MRSLSVPDWTQSVLRLFEDPARGSAYRVRFLLRERRPFTTANPLASSHGTDELTLGVHSGLMKVAQVRGQDVGTAEHSPD